MKKSVYIILSLTLVLALFAGCGTTAENTSTPAQTQTAAEPDPNVPVSGEASDEPGESAEETEPTAAVDPMADEKFQKQVYAMDTVMILTAYGSNAETALDAAEERILSLEADLDPENPGGSIYALNAGAGNPVKISDDAMTILQTALYYYSDTNGALDPGLYPIINAWGFITDEYRVPEQSELDTLLAQKDTDGIVLDTEAGTACIPLDTQISLGAVAKGYTAQAVMDLMADYGVTSAILSLGGNVQTLGNTKPNGNQWQVAIVDPNDTGSYVGILSLGQDAAVTSGGYQRFFEQDGVTYIHIIDPATGRPVDNDLLSVTVVTADGTSADALSTSIFVMGKDAALDYYEQHDDFELVLITTDNEVIVTPGLVDCFSEDGSGYTYTYLE